MAHFNTTFRSYRRSQFGGFQRRRPAHRDRTVTGRRRSIPHSTVVCLDPKQSIARRRIPAAHDRLERDSVRKPFGDLAGAERTSRRSCDRSDATLTVQAPKIDAAAFPETLW